MWQTLSEVGIMNDWLTLYWQSLAVNYPSSVHFLDRIFLSADVLGQFLSSGHLATIEAILPGGNDAKCLIWSGMGILLGAHIL